MQTENVNIVLGLPASAATEVAALYFDIFPRKLGVALGRRKGRMAPALPRRRATTMQP